MEDENVKGKSQGSGSIMILYTPGPAKTWEGDFGGLVELAHACNDCRVRRHDMVRDTVHESAHEVVHDIVHDIVDAWS